MPKVRDSLGTQLGTVELRNEPWKHAYDRHSIPPDLAEVLYETFPAIDGQVSKLTGPKTYVLSTHEMRTEDASAASPSWAVFVAAVTSQEYREALARSTGVDLIDADCSVDIWEYKPEGWLAPHLDKPNKLVTQIFYLSGWQEEYGGRLQILRSRTEIVDQLAPHLGSSAVIVRSDSSWHSVEKIVASSPPRRSLTVQFLQQASSAPPSM